MQNSISTDNTLTRITTIGGGTGQPQLLAALRTRTDCVLSAIVTTMDSGSSSGVLREAYNIIPPGDIRRALSALSDDPKLSEWWNYRVRGGALDNHTIGNMVLTGLTQQYGNMTKAIEVVQRLFHIRGAVIPVSEQPGILCAELEDGSCVRGEHAIDMPAGPRARIQRIFLEQPIQISLSAREAILQADYILLSFGDVYTSVLPNLLVDGVRDAIADSKAMVVAMCNRSTKPGETDGWSYGDVYRVYSQYLSPARIALMICDTQQTPIPSGAEAFAVHGIPENVAVVWADCADQDRPEHISAQKMVDAFCAYANIS